VRALSDVRLLILDENAFYDLMHNNPIAAMDLLRDGFEVTLVADAISSRTAQNRDIALQRMASEGAKLASTEMVLFELLNASGTEEFKAISKLVK